MRYTLITYCIALLLIAEFATCLTGCVSVDKQILKARKVFDQYPNEAAKYCGESFKIKEVLIRGKDSLILKSDTVIVAGLRIPCPDRLDTVTCPSVKNITRYISRIDTLVKENTALVDSYKGQNIVLGQQNETLTKSVEAETSKYKKWFWIAIGLMAVIIIYGAYRLYLFITGGFAVSLLKKNL